MKTIPLKCAIAVNKNALVRRDAYPPVKSLAPHINTAQML